MDLADLEFDESKYYLGKLCKRGHDWKGTGYSIRYNRGGCVKCRRKAKKKNRRARKIKFNPDIHYIGELCWTGHFWEDQYASLRYKRNGKCVVCTNNRKMNWYRRNREVLVPIMRERSRARGHFPKSKLPIEEAEKRNKKAREKWEKKNPDVRRKIARRNKHKKPYMPVLIKLHGKKRKEVEEVVQEQIDLKMQLLDLKRKLRGKDAK